VEARIERVPNKGTETEKARDVKAEVTADV